MKVILNHFIFENMQLVKKKFIDTGILSKDEIDIVSDVTNKDNYSYIIASYIEHLHMLHPYDDINKIRNRAEIFYEMVKKYNKNVFPIDGFDVIHFEDIMSVSESLSVREKIIELTKKLPSLAIRNLKNDIREPRTLLEFKSYHDDLQYFIGYYSYLLNKPEDVQDKFAKKMFKSNVTLDDLMDFVDDKEFFLGGSEFSKKDIAKIAENEDLEITYDKGDIMIVKVFSAEGIKTIGCNSLWCFTYGKGYSQAIKEWGQFSYNDMVYVIIDYKESPDSPSFMYVVVKPIDFDNEYEEDDDDNPLYDMANDAVSNPLLVMQSLFGKNYENVIEEYLDFEY